MKEPAKRREEATKKIEEISEEGYVTEAKRRWHFKKKSTVIILNVAVPSSKIKAEA